MVNSTMVQDCDPSSNVSDLTAEDVQQLSWIGRLSTPEMNTDEDQSFLMAHTIALGEESPNSYSEGTNRKKSKKRNLNMWLQKKSTGISPKLGMAKFMNKPTRAVIRDCDADQFNLIKKLGDELERSLNATVLRKDTESINIQLPVKILNKSEKIIHANINTTQLENFVDIFIERTFKDIILISNIEFQYFVEKVHAYLTANFSCNKPIYQTI